MFDPNRTENAQSCICDLPHGDRLYGRLRKTTRVNQALLVGAVPNRSLSVEVRLCLD
jgi:hypothetical protein